MKAKLDKIFTKKKRVLLSTKTLKKAGFLNPKARKFTRLIVVKHEEIPGFVFKIYLDSQRYYKDVPEYNLWIQRIKGVARIRQVIKQYQLEEYFKTPTKWIYLVPERPAPPEDFLAKVTILVEEDMNLLSAKANAERWKSDLVSKPLLDGLYKILKLVGLKDCCKIDNIPFSTDGRVAFIDTQTYGETAIPYKVVGKALSDENKRYWKHIIGKK